MHLQGSLAILDSDIRQKASTLIFDSSIRQQAQHARLSAALQTPPTQQPVRGDSDITRSKARQHMRSFAFGCCKGVITHATAAGNIHKTTYATTLSHREAQAEETHSKVWGTEETREGDNT